jgi:hypothetical protein
MASSSHDDAPTRVAWVPAEVVRHIPEDERHLLDMKSELRKEWRKAYCAHGQAVNKKFSAKKLATLFASMRAVVRKAEAIIQQHSDAWSIYVADVDPKDTSDTAVMACADAVGDAVEAIKEDPVILKESHLEAVEVGSKMRLTLAAASEALAAAGALEDQRDEIAQRHGAAISILESDASTLEDVVAQVVETTMALLDERSACELDIKIVMDRFMEDFVGRAKRERLDDNIDDGRGKRFKVPNANKQASKQARKQVSR